MIRLLRKPRTQSMLNVTAFLSTLAAMPLVTGCSREPSLNILGSFFPAWILCGSIGIMLAVATRLAFLRLNFEKELSPVLLVYPCLAASFTFTIWLVFFS